MHLPMAPDLTERVEALPGQPVAGELSVRVTVEWLSLWKALETLDISVIWGVWCFTLLDRRSAVVVFNDGCWLEGILLAQECQGGTAQPWTLRSRTPHGTIPWHMG